MACGGRVPDDGSGSPPVPSSAGTSPSGTPAPTSVPPRPADPPRPGATTSPSGEFACGPKRCKAPLEDCCYTDALATACVPHGTCNTPYMTSCDSGNCTNGGTCCIDLQPTDAIITASHCGFGCAPPAEAACNGYDDRCVVGVCNNTVLNIFSCQIR